MEKSPGIVAEVLEAISNSIKSLFAIIKETEKYVPDFQSEIIDLSRLNKTGLPFS
jgi:hypothetical protein